MILQYAANWLHLKSERLEDELVMRDARRWLNGLGDVQQLTLIRRIFNVVVVGDARNCFKVGYREPNTVRREYAQALALRARFPTLASYVPDLDLLELKGARPCLRVPRLQTMSVEWSIAGAKQILAAFWDQGQRAVGDVKDLPNVQRGIRIVAMLSPRHAQVIEDAATRAAAQPMHWGPAHGDFHRGNLVAGANGRAQMIDFDCVRMRAPQEFDWLYFHAELAVARDGVPWTSVMTQHFQAPLHDLLGAKEHGLAPFGPGVSLLYVLDRIAQEEKFGIRIDESTAAGLASASLAALHSTERASTDSRSQ